MELKALKSIIMKELQKCAEDVTVDSEILHSIYSWDQMKLEGVTIGSSSSGFSDCAVSRENYFIWICKDREPYALYILNFNWIIHHQVSPK